MWNDFIAGNFGPRQEKQSATIIVVVFVFGLVHPLVDFGSVCPELGEKQKKKTRLNKVLEQPHKGKSILTVLFQDYKGQSFWLGQSTYS